MNPFVSAEFTAIVVLATIGLIGLLMLRPSMVVARGGAALLFVALFVLPVAAIRSGLRLHWESSKTTEFCMSCHVMEPYGQSMVMEDETSVPAAHFQNRRVNYDKACFDCHSQYTIFGDTKAKMVGLQHLWVYFTGQTPEKIELYEPFMNRECLYCHRGARHFEKMHEHDMKELLANEIGCLSCHGVGHEIDSLATAEMWKPSLAAALGNE